MLRPVMARRLQQGIGPDDIGLHERGRAIDGAVDVTLRSEVNDAVRLVRIEQSRYRGRIRDVHLLEVIARVSCNARHGVQIARISKAVHVHNQAVRILDEVADQR